MSWAEFRIRLFAFKRMRNYEFELFRIHAYHTATGGLYAFDPKKFPKNINSFWKPPKRETVEEQDKRKKRLEVLAREKRKYQEKITGNGE